MKKKKWKKARRLAKLDKRLDWVERVIRLEESPLISQSFQKQLEDDKKYDIEYKEKLEKEHQQEWEHSTAEKQRLLRMVTEKQNFEQQIMKIRKEEFEKLKKERDERLAIKKAKIIEERERRKKEEIERQNELEKQRQIKEEEDRKKKKRN